MRSFLPALLNWKQFLPLGHGIAREIRDTWRLSNGTAVTVRASRSDDGPLIQALVRGLSMQSRYQRFFYPVHELTPDMLDRFTHNAPTEAMTLLAVTRVRGHETAVAMAQYVADRYPESGDIAVVVADQWQGQGLGKRLIQALICLARAAGIARLDGDVLAENEEMKRLMMKLGFRVTQHAEGAYLRKVWRELEVPKWRCSPLTALAGQFG